jgi:hypothetical protein
VAAHVPSATLRRADRSPNGPFQRGGQKPTSTRRASGCQRRVGRRELTFVDVDLARDTFVRTESTRRQFALAAALELARLRALAMAAP